MKRGNPIARKTRVKPVNKERKAAEFERTYGGAERVVWIGNQPCVICGAKPCENAHVKGGGMGRKADAKWIVPLCRTHHHELHQHGQINFECCNAVDLHWLAQVIDARYEQYVAAHQIKQVTK